MKKTRGEKVFNVVNLVFLALLGLTCVLPFVQIIAKSLSDNVSVLAREVTFIPKGLNINAYRFVVGNSQFRRSFSLTVLIPGGRFIAILYIVTMFFGGGMIATYILYKQIGLIDNLWVLILPASVNPFNIVLMRNFFESISPSLEESAKIDGASNTLVLFRIILPLSQAALATIGLFFGVTYWNSFIGAVLYTTKRELMTMQLYLRNVLTAADNLMDTNSEMLDTLATETVRAATIMAAMIPILCVYPFVQKYFVSGIMIGAVKG
jgi:putative aldouronate transport system permease protein